MIIAHAPGGYLFSTWLLRNTPAVERRWALRWGVAGSIAPDLDMLWFHLADHGQRNHHLYWSHWPVTWLLLILGMYLLRGRTRWARCGWLFAANGMLHMVLDSVVGRIWWLAPWVDRPFSLATVHPWFQPWWLNFLAHPSFGLELLICAAAGLVWYRNRSAKTFVPQES